MRADCTQIFALSPRRFDAHTFCVKRREPFDCPNCGAEVPAGAAACPECGSDERTGWSEDETVYDGTGIEEPKEFSYDEWLKKEGVGRKRFSNKRIWIVVVVLLLLAALGVYLAKRWASRTVS